jgi:hypothetical protein
VPNSVADNNLQLSLVGLSENKESLNIKIPNPNISRMDLCHFQISPFLAQKKGKNSVGNAGNCLGVCSSNLYLLSSPPTKVQLHNYSLLKTSFRDLEIFDGAANLLIVS